MAVNNFKLENTKVRCLFYLSNLDMIERIKYGQLTPEECIKLAYINPAFKTPYSITIQNEQFFGELNQLQQFYFILSKITDLTRIEEKERAEFFKNIELIYEHDEFIERFNEQISEATDFERVLNSVVESQIQQFVKRLDEVITSNNKRIKEIDDEISQLQERKISVKLELDKLNNLSNQLLLKAFENIKFSDNHKILLSADSVVMIKKYDPDFNKVDMEVTQEEVAAFFRDYIKEHMGEKILFTESDYQDVLKQFIAQKVQQICPHLPTEVQQRIIDDEMRSSAPLVNGVMKDIQDSVYKQSNYQRAKDLKQHVVVKEKWFEEMDAAIADLSSEKNHLMELNKELEGIKKDLSSAIQDKISIKEVLDKAAQQVELVGGGPVMQQASVDTKSILRKMGIESEIKPAPAQSTVKEQLEVAITDEDETSHFKPRR